LVLRDAVEEGDDDESDDGEGGGGDHGVLLLRRFGLLPVDLASSDECFRNRWARSGIEPRPRKNLFLAHGWDVLRRAPLGVLRNWSVRIPTRKPGWISLNPP
jgi:hypothetical protein